MDKKTIILKVALELFSERGYAATSTRMISKQAAVSEGLIFRHYQNKDGLLKALYAEGISKIEELYEPMLKLKHPKVFLKQVLSIPFLIKEDNCSIFLGLKKISAGPPILNQLKFERFLLIDT